MQTEYGKICRWHLQPKINPRSPCEFLCLANQNVSRKVGGYIHKAAKSPRKGAVRGGSYEAFL